jgi:hypothetical protein
MQTICLQETKMQSCSHRLVLYLLGPDFDNNFVTLNSVGASGGVLLAWRSKLGAIVDSRVDVFGVLSNSVQLLVMSGG